MKIKYAALVTTILISTTAHAEDYTELVSAFDPIKINAPKNLNPNTFLDREGSWNWSIAAMKGNVALSKGYDGSIYNRKADGSLVDNIADGRTTVAVIDTGVNSRISELDANVLASKSVTCTTNGGCRANGGIDTGWHGTAVAGVIAAERNGFGMQGIAPNTQILPIAAIGVANGSISDSINYAVRNNAKIINNSYGLSNSAGDIPIIAAKAGRASAAMAPTQLNSYLSQRGFETSLRDSIQNAVNARSILVFANGNAGMDQVGVLAGLPYYFRGNLAANLKPAGYDLINPNKWDWSKNFVAVAALDSNLGIASYSNRCGIAKEWCISAPGSNVISTYITGQYVQASGTSFAAPNVSGALAVLTGAFPHLSPENVTQIMFKTATDLGVKGVDDVYGNGLVNLERAVAPSDSGWKLAMTTSTTTGTKSVASSQITLPASFGASLKKSNLNVMFLDEDNKDYQIPVSSLVTDISGRVSADQRLAAFGANKFAYDVSNENGVFKASFSETKEGEKPMIEKSFTSINTKIDKDRDYTTSFAYNVNLGEVMNQAAFSDMKVTSNDETTAFKNPYLGLADNVNAAVVGLAGKNDTVKLGFFSGDINENPDDFSTSQQISGAFAEIGFGATSMTFGVNNEENALLGASSTGALSFGDAATTAYVSIATKQKVTDKLSVMANYNIGQTKVDGTTSSLVKDTSNLVSDSFAVGMEYAGLVDADDKLQVSVSQPLRVMSGTSNLSLPQDVDVNGDVQFVDEKVSLAATGRQLDLNTFYDTKLSENESLKLGGVVSFDSGNDSSQATEATLMMKYSLSF